MRRVLLLPIALLNALAFVALAVLLLYGIDAPRASFGVIVVAGIVLAGVVAALSGLILVTNTRRPRGIDPDEAPPPPGIDERRQAHVGRRHTDVAPNDVRRVIAAVDAIRPAWAQEHVDRGNLLDLEDSE